jgi:hypothetical protein
MKYEIYKDSENIHWLISTNSMRYEHVKKDKELQADFSLRGDAFNWLNDKGILRQADGFESGYYEIYV